MLVRYGYSTAPNNRVGRLARPATGSRVRVSDASPHGFCGRVTAVNPGALTVARDDNGAWDSCSYHGGV